MLKPGGGWRQALHAFAIERSLQVISDRRGAEEGDACSPEGRRAGRISLAWISHIVRGPLGAGQGPPNSSTDP